MEKSSAVKAAHPWRSIRVRFTALFVATLAVLLTGAAIVLYVTAEAIVIREADEALATRASSVVDVISKHRNALDIGVVQDQSFHVGRVYPDYFYYGLFPSPEYSSKPLYSTTVNGNPKVIRMLSETAKSVPVRTFEFVGQRRFRFRVLVIPTPSPSQMLVVATPWDPNEYRLERLVAILSYLMAVVLIVAGLGCYVMIGRTLEPIYALVAQAERLSVERLQPELLPEQAAEDTELNHLVRALNGMVGRLQSALSAQRQFAADASHELRTPLTILRGEMELALQKERDNAEYRSVLESGLDEAKRLSNIVEALGVLARGDASEWRSGDYAAVDLDALLRGLVDGFRQAAATAGLTLEYNGTGGEAVIHGDKDGLRRALSNLIENGIRYTTAGGSVTVSMVMGGGEARIGIEDTGAGIDPAEAGRVFDRFFRSPRTRGMREGSGLGLAIASSIVRAHGGEIRVNSAVGQGSTFIVRLPVDIS